MFLIESIKRGLVKVMTFYLFVRCKVYDAFWFSLHVFSCKIVWWWVTLWKVSRKRSLWWWEFGGEYKYVPISWSRGPPDGWSPMEGRYLMCRIFDVRRLIFVLFIHQFLDFNFSLRFEFWSFNFLLTLIYSILPTLIRSTRSSKDEGSLEITLSQSVWS